MPLTITELCAKDTVIRIFVTKDYSTNKEYSRTGSSTFRTYGPSPGNGNGWEEHWKRKTGSSYSVTSHYPLSSQVIPYLARKSLPVPWKTGLLSTGYEGRMKKVTFQKRKPRGAWLAQSV